MPRPISASISIPALRHNLSIVRRHLDQAAQSAGGQAASIWAVIKANAYGHGIERAVAGFSAAQGLAMLDLDEAVRCREAGWGGPILLLEGFFKPADLEVVDRYHLTVAVHCDEQFDMIEEAKLSRRLDIQLKLNTGMNRLGFVPGAYTDAYARAETLQRRGVLGSVIKMTHFATADGPQGIADALGVFRQATQWLGGGVSICNSAATLRYSEISVSLDGEPNWVRPGVCLYGASPFDDVAAVSYGLRPAMTLRSEIIGVQSVSAGSAIGYGATFRPERRMRIGVAACGYADGYPRHAPTGTPVTVAGVSTRVVGRVSMDMLMVDLDPVPHVGIGAPVVLWGEGGPSIDEVAQVSGTIGYELMCALAPRVPVQTLG
jgi:alanine racemase